MTDLEQRIREAYDAQHASMSSADARWPFEEERKRRADASFVEVHCAPLRQRPRARVVVTALAACLCSRLPSSVPMACIARRLLSWTLR